MKYPAIPNISPEERLDNMFGCVEMEQAAYVILQQVIKHQSWTTKIWYEDFSGDELKGFIMLAAHGWLLPTYPNGMVFVHPDFAKRVVKLLPIDQTKRHLE